jgi:hypothetical protein
MSSIEQMNYYDRFLSPAERHIATHELASLEKKALPILESLFNGSAKNEFGVPYNKIGATSCGYVTIKLLGAIAKPLEVYVRGGIEKDDSNAIEAAGYLCEIGKETAIALAKALVRNPASEAGASLVRCNKSDNPEVTKIISSDTTASKSFAKTKAYMSKT